MTNPNRLGCILCDPKRQVQLIFAGKAHPKDNEGKKFVRRIVSLGQQPRFYTTWYFWKTTTYPWPATWSSRRRLAQQSPPWRPLRHRNDALNLSILDCWWNEGSGQAWAFYDDEGYEDEEACRPRSKSARSTAPWKIRSCRCSTTVTTTVTRRACPGASSHI